VEIVLLPSLSNVIILIFFYLNCASKLQITVILINKGHKLRRFGRMKDVKKTWWKFSGIFITKCALNA